jgi:hypothetical protein
MDAWVLIPLFVAWLLVNEVVRLRRRVDQLGADVRVELANAERARDAAETAEAKLEHAHEQLDDLRLHLARAEQVGHADSSLRARGFQVVHVAWRSRRAALELN